MNESNYERRTPVTRGEININLEGILRKVFETLLVIISFHWRSSPYLRNEKSRRGFWTKFIFIIDTSTPNPPMFLHQLHEKNSTRSQKILLLYAVRIICSVTDSLIFWNRNGPSSCYCISLLSVKGLSHWTLLKLR
jgi:hypothetical protein